MLPGTMYSHIELACMENSVVNLQVIYTVSSEKEKQCCSLEFSEDVRLMVSAADKPAEADLL